MWYISDFVCLKVLILHYISRSEIVWAFQITELFWRACLQLVKNVQHVSCCWRSAVCCVLQQWKQNIFLKILNRTTSTICRGEKLISWWVVMADISKQIFCKCPFYIFIKCCKLQELNPNWKWSLSSEELSTSKSDL